MVLTTCRDDQDRVDIQFFRTGVDGQADEALGTLSLGDLPAGDHHSRDLQLDLELDEDNTLRATVLEPVSGNSGSLAMSLDGARLSDIGYVDEPYHVPESLSDSDLFMERDEAIQENTRRRETGVVALAVLLLLLLLAAGAVLLVWWLRRAPALEDPGPVEAPAAVTAPAPADGVQPQEEQRDPAPQVVPDPPEEPPAAPAEAQLPPAAPPAPPDAVDTDIAYRILRGDTLWDISTRFYGTPWRFPDIARYNRIRNPDLIFAEDNIVIPAK